MKITNAMPTVTAKMRSSAPLCWSYPAARRTSFHQSSSRLPIATVTSSEASDPNRIVAIPSDGESVQYWTCEPNQSQK